MKISTIFWGGDLTLYPSAPYSKFLDPPLINKHATAQQR